MNPYALLPLVGFIANFALAAAVFTKSPRDRPNRVYAVLCLCIGWWAVLKFARLLVTEDGAALLLFQVSAFGWCLLPSLYVDFVLSYVHRNEPPRVLSWMPVLHVAGLSLAVAGFLPESMAKSILWEPWGSSHEPGALYDVFALYSFTMFVLGLVVLVRGRSRQRSPTIRRQYSFILFGGLIPVIAGSVTNIWLPVAGIFVVPLGEVLSTFNVAIVGYAMARHGLLGVSLEQAAETIIATMGDVLLVVNAEGDVVVANAAAATLLGRAKTDIVGHNVQELVSSDLLRDGSAGLARSAALESEGELLANGRDPVPVIISTRQVRDATGNVVGAVLVAKDIRQLRGAILELAAANERLERQSITDELTGVSNRRHTNQRLREEIELAARYHRPFSIGVLDLDDFKQINDQHGHQTGDRVLETVAREIKAVLRDADVVSRWGGDEFFVILGEANEARARDIGERIVARIGRASVAGLDEPVRASLGLATFDPTRPPPTSEELVRKADDALYEAKRSGKARVVAA